jgi:hypothetical protein
MEQQGQRRLSNSSAANKSLQRPSVISRATSAPVTATMPSSSISRPLLAPLRAKTESQHSKPPPTPPPQPRERPNLTVDTKLNATTVRVDSPKALSLQGHHRRIASADNSVLSMESATSAAADVSVVSSSGGSVTSRTVLSLPNSSSAVIFRPTAATTRSSSMATATTSSASHSLQHFYHHRRIRSATSSLESVAGSSVSATASSDVSYASLLGNRPKRTVFPKEDTVVLTMEGYCAKESMHRMVNLTPSEVVVRGSTGQNCPTLTAKEFKRQARHEREQRDERLEFIPPKSRGRSRGRRGHGRRHHAHWRLELQYHWKQIVLLRQRFEKDRAVVASGQMDKPDLVRNPRGCLC